MNAAEPLVFSWAPPRRRARALIVFLIASAVLHAVGFYLFQIVYPPTVTLIPPPARVGVISPDNAESLTFLRWIESEDPALTTTTQRPPETKSFSLPILEHRPSYADYEPQLRRLPEVIPNLTVPSSVALGPPPVPRLRANTNVAVRQTVATFADTSPELGAPSLPAFAFQISRPDAPANARFRVAISRAGIVQHCFLIESSGDAALDEQARSFLLCCRFPSSAGDDSGTLFWTVATILWGNDVAPGQQKSPSPP